MNLFGYVLLAVIYGKPIKIWGLNAVTNFSQSPFSRGCSLVWMCCKNITIFLRIFSVIPGGTPEKWSTNVKPQFVGDEFNLHSANPTLNALPILHVNSKGNGRPPSLCNFPRQEAYLKEQMLSQKETQTAIKLPICYWSTNINEINKKVAQKYTIWCLLGFWDE